MSDTPKHVLRKQFEVVMAIPLDERIKNLFEMTELSRRIVKNRLKVSYPELTESELEIELFKAFYHSDFDDQSMNQIVESMRRFWEKRNESL